MPITAVLFDVGGVLVSSPFEAFARYERERGLPDGFIRRVNATDHHRNAWARLERNELDADGFDRAFAADSEALGHRVAGRDVLELLIGDLRPEMVEAVRRCTDRLSTAMVTNNVASSSDNPMFAELKGLFTVVVESSVEGVRKPEPAFYELTCERLGITPDQAVYLDDLGVNLKPAREMGMTTIKVEDPAVALDELEAVVGFALR